MAGRNCIVVGAGRSGTSMVAGTLATSGYFVGDDLHPPRAANPKGFFEGPLVKEINEDLLDPLVPRHPVNALVNRSLPQRGSRWLARIPLDAEVRADPALTTRIQSAVERTPFAYKDPRFCYTLPAWRPFLPKDTGYICVFREPARTAHSLVKECREAVWLRDLHLSFKDALRLWELMYRHVLEQHSREGNWLYVHYDQFFDGSAYHRIEDHLGIPVNRTFADIALRRSPAVGRVASSQHAVYSELCERAQFKGGERRV